MPLGSGRKYDYDYTSKLRKARTAFNFYLQDNFHILRRELRDHDPHRIISEAGRRWRGVNFAESMPVPMAERMKYMMLAEKDMIRARQEQLHYLQQVVDGLVVPEAARIRVTKRAEYPKLPRNAFIFYMRATRGKVSAEYPNLNSSQVLEKVGQRWHELPDKRKKRYKRQLRADQRRYRDEKQRYRQWQQRQRQQKLLIDSRKRLIRLSRKTLVRRILISDPSAVPAN